MPNTLFRMLICGATETGKYNGSYLLKPLIYYDKICLHAKNLEQDKYNYLSDKYPVGTRRRFNVEAWLKFRRDVVSTLIQR